MLLGLLRDRGALAMAFAIPPALFLVLAAAFAQVSPELTRAGGAAGYYAGAVAIMFLLFSAAEGAIALVEESASGSVERCLPSGADRARILAGKFLFLTVLGCVQTALLFAVAWQVHDVPLTRAPWRWAATTLAAAAAASALGLAIAAACTSRKQAHAVSNAIILVCSAAGGSMVPRFAMPGWLRAAGRFLPTAWAIDAYQGALIRNVAAADLIAPWTALAASAALALGFALVMMGWHARRAA
jgi:ABC-2 type transport system permease protein